MATYEINQITLPNGDVCNLEPNPNYIIPITQGGTGATTAADAKANLSLGTSSMNFTVANMSGENQQWMLRSTIVNSNNQYYGDRTALIIQDEYFGLGRWDTNGNYLGSLWNAPMTPASDTKPGYVTTGTQTFAGNKTYTGSVTAKSLSVERDAGGFVKFGYSSYEYGSIYYDNTSGGKIGFEVYDETIEANNLFWFPSVEDGDGSGAEYDILTTKNFGSLDFKTRGEHLTSGTNVDTALDYGTTYYVNSSTEAAGLTGDVPVTGAGFKIIQFRSYNSAITYSKQFALTSTHKIYMRQRTSTTAWSDWLQFQPVRLIPSTVTLSTGSWSSNTQSVTVTGLGASDDVFVSAAPDSVTAYRQNGIYCSSQAANTLTFTCATTPTTNITVNIRAYG